MDQQQLKAIEYLENIFRTHGMTDFRWIETHHIVVAQWVRMKCMYGCGDYGKCAACPPNVPTVTECERFFREYAHAVIFHFEKQFEDPTERHAWSAEINARLLKVERDVFIAGYEKVFLLFMDGCQLCHPCSSRRTKCKQPKLARPSPEAMAMDVFSTVRAAEYRIEVLSDYAHTMNRFAFLFVE